MENKLDNFESFLKESLSNHEVAYNPSAWDKLNASLPKTPFYKTTGFLAVAGILLVGGIAYTVLPSPNSEKETTVTPVVSNTISENNQTEANVVAIETTPETTNNEQVSIEPTPQTEEVVSKKITSVSKNNTKTSASNTEKKGITNTSMELAKDKIETPLVEPKTTPIAKPIAVTNSTKPALNKADFQLKPSYCEGDLLILEAKNPDASLVYTWLDNGKVIGDKNKITVRKLDEGNNTITLVTETKDGEKLGATSYETKFFAAPQIMQENDLTKQVNTYTFSTNSAYENITWNFGDGQTSNATTVMHSYPKQGQFNVKLTVKDSHGCSYTKETKIANAGYYNYVRDWPFTPNGNGSLDYFMPMDIKAIVQEKNLNESFNMKIYDRRTRALLFESKSVDNAWDGRDLEGKLVKMNEAYIWYIELTNELGFKEVYTGSVTAAKE